MMARARALMPALLGLGFAAALRAAPAAAPGRAGSARCPARSKKIKNTGTITLGYRESSLPFSYLNQRQQPIGYSIDLCREIVEEAATELDGMDIKIALAPVTAANRLDKVKSARSISNAARPRAISSARRRWRFRRSSSLPAPS